LAAIFAIDVAAYAILSSHYHIVLRVDRDRALGWSTEAVLRRWTQLFSGPVLVQRYLSDARSDMTDAEMRKVDELAALYRTRLHDLSWFMRTLNEFIARKANAEDGVTGRFWEGRFKSQALLDEKALLAAMAYVDLNPVRAGMAETPETSDYTSIQERLKTLPDEQAPENHASQPKAPADAPAQAIEGAALQPVELTEDNHPGRIRFDPLPNLKGESIAAWAQNALSQSVHLVTDGLPSLAAAAPHVAEYGAIILGRKKSSELDLFRWVNTFISNLKTAIGGTYHHIDAHKYRARYLAEAQYRVNRRFELRSLVDRLLVACARIPPRPEHWLRHGFAEAS